MKFGLTYRHYDQFVDVFFYLNILVLLTVAAGSLGWQPQSEAEMLRADFLAAMVLEFFVKIGSYAAIFWRSLRDEYAERLWQKTVASFAKIVLFLPWVFVILMMALYTAGHPMASWLPKDPLQSILPTLPFDEPKFRSVSWHESQGVVETIGWIWKYAPFLFLALYKWHRWREQD